MHHQLRGLVHPQVILACLVGLFGLVAWQAFHNPPTDYLEHPQLYGLLAAVAALCALVTLVGPTARHAWPRRLLGRSAWQAVAGAAVVTACWVRAVALAWSAWDMPSSDADRQAARWVGVALWAVTGELLMAVWLMVIIPWAVRSRNRQAPRV